MSMPNTASLKTTQPLWNILRVGASGGSRWIGSLYSRKSHSTYQGRRIYLRMLGWDCVWYLYFGYLFFFYGRLIFPSTTAFPWMPGWLYPTDYNIFTSLTSCFLCMVNAILVGLTISLNWNSVLQEGRRVDPCIPLAFVSSVEGE